MICRVSCVFPAIVLSLLTYSTCVAQKSKCEQDAEFYQTQNYTIRDVRVDTPLAWLFGSVAQEVDAALSSPDMPVKSGAAFSKADFNRSFTFLVGRLPELTVSKEERVRFRLSKPDLADCDSNSKSLVVVYHIYTFAFSDYLSRAFETGLRDQMKRSVVNTQSTKTLSNFFPQPFGGYNRSRAIFGGSKLSLDHVPLVDRLVFEGSGSSSSSEALAEGEGLDDYGAGLIRHSEYKFRYLYSSLPGDQIKIAQGYGLAQFFAATKPFGPTELVIRFGALAEAGNKLTNLHSAQVLPDNLSDAKITSLKTFVGANLRVGENAQAIKVSYGLQLGSAGPGLHLDYAKQVFDSAANLRFPFADHRVVTAELQLSAGSISTRHELPVAERFFGGNEDQNFTASDSFVIRSNPVIRSFAQNAFNRNSASGVFGGDRFFSSNATITATLWRKPLVPSQIVDDDFNTAAEIGLNFAESTLKTEYLKEKEEFKAMTNGVAPISNSLNELAAELNGVDTPRLAQNVKDQLALVRKDLQAASETAAKIKKDSDESSINTGDIRKLVVGFPAVPVDSEVTTLVTDAGTLSSMQGLPVNNLSTVLSRLEKNRVTMATNFNDLLKSSAEKSAEGRARQEMVYPRRVFYQLVNEANLIAVSPGLLFDTARLWQKDISGGRFKVGVGPAVRVTIVSLDLTAGYAVNVNRQPWEGRGAFVFSMQASNLFR